ncbi:hypothetical protein [Vulcanisaeta distributa]|uniref:hypothetical protein n=1 Tax=Vulcanisaeta distributa TaxID=164451 RepID=UPI0006D16CF4|nr:hypothetical protein [Vulcanisaeta distributa]
MISMPPGIKCGIANDACDKFLRGINQAYDVECGNLCGFHGNDLISDADFKQYLKQNFTINNIDSVAACRVDVSVDCHKLQMQDALPCCNPSRQYNWPDVCILINGSIRINVDCKCGTHNMKYNDPVELQNIINKVKGNTIVLVKMSIRNKIRNKIKSKYAYNFIGCHI